MKLNNFPNDILIFSLFCYWNIWFRIMQISKFVSEQILIVEHSFLFNLPDFFGRIYITN